MQSYVKGGGKLRSSWAFHRDWLTWLYLLGAWNVCTVPWTASFLVFTPTKPKRQSSALESKYLSGMSRCGPCSWTLCLHRLFPWRHTLVNYQSTREQSMVHSLAADGSVFTEGVKLHTDLPSEQCHRIHYGNASPKCGSVYLHQFWPTPCLWQQPLLLLRGRDKKFCIKKPDEKACSHSC